MPEPSEYASFTPNIPGAPLEGNPLQGTPLKSLPSTPIGSRRSPFPKPKTYSRKVATPAEKKVEGTLNLRDPDSDEFIQIPLQEGGITSFMGAMDEATGIAGYGERAYQGGALGDFGTQGFIPQDTSAGTIPSATGGFRVPTEAFRQSLDAEQQMQFFEGALPPEPGDVDRFQWETATPEERMERQIALAGHAPPETGIPEFMPGVEPKPKFGTQSGLEPLDSRHAFMSLLEVSSRPFEAFSEAAFRTGKAGLIDEKWDNSIVDLITNANQFVAE